MSTADTVILLISILVIAVGLVGWVAVTELHRLRVAIRRQSLSGNEEAEKRAAWFLEQLEMQVGLLRRLVQRAEETLYQRELRELDEQYAAGQIDGHAHWQRTSFLVERKEKHDDLGRSQPSNNAAVRSGDH